MAKKCIAVLEIGSSKISCIVGTRNSSDTFDISAYSTVEYAGFMEGSFLEPEALPKAIAQAITDAEISAQKYITHLYIGVPAEFSVVEVKSARKVFARPKKVTVFDVDEMFEEAEGLKKSSTHLVIGRSPVFFELSDKRKVVDPIGEITSSLNATLSFVLGEQGFISEIGRIMKTLSVPNVEFVSETLAECMFVVDPAKRDESAVLVDCGFITTSVSMVMGDGIVALSSFSLGGGHLSGDLYKCLELPYNVCESLKRKAVISIAPEADDYYEVSVDGQTHKISAQMANEILIDRIVQIADVITKCIAASNITFPEDKPILLTGGGLGLMRGVRDQLGKRLNRRIEIAVPSVPELDRPNLSAGLSLLNLALDQPPTVKLNIFKIFGKK